MESKEKRKEFLIGLSLYSVINIVFYLFVYLHYNMIYGINDDWTLYMVISGSYLGVPEPRVNYMMYPLAWFLGKLYSLTSAIPWYGLMLQGCTALCGGFVFFRIYELMEKGIKRMVYSSLGLLLVLFSYLGIIISIQFTQVGAICGACAIFLFFTAKTKGCGGKEYLFKNIPTIIMAVLSLNIRENTLYMCLPIAGMMLISKWFVEDRAVNKEVIARYAGFILVLGVFLGGTIVSHKIAYSSPQWKEYVRVNNIWTRGVDYYGFPDAEEIEELLAQNGMTKEDYEISLAYQTFYRGEMKYSDFLTEITDLGKEKYEERNPFSVKLKEANEKIVSCLTVTEIKPLNYVVCVLFVITLLLIINSRDKNAVICFLFYLFGRFFAWYFLLFAGRFPDRIPQGLFAMDFMVLLGFLLYFPLWEKRGLLQSRAMRMAGNVLIVLVFSVIFMDGMKTLDGATEYVDIYQDRWYGIKEYCGEHPENRYFLSGGSQTLKYYSDKILETDTIGKTQNFYTNTNFDSPSPNFYDMMGAEYESYLGDDFIEKENHYWIYEKGCFSEEADIVKFYLQEYDTFQYELVDTFDTETTTFEVYHFSK